MAEIDLILGDITQQKVDAIVNAANTTLLGGGGVDGAIHRAAGPELLEECEALGGCPTGEAKITKGYHLAAKFVIHTVGPVWHDGIRHEDALLRSCYIHSLELAEKNRIETLAFPSISTGAYRFPTEKACRIAVGAVREFLKQAKTVKKVIFVCFSQKDLELYQKELSQGR